MHVLGESSGVRSAPHRPSGQLTGDVVVLRERDTSNERVPVGCMTRHDAAELEGSSWRSAGGLCRGMSSEDVWPHVAGVCVQGCSVLALRRSEVGLAVAVRMQIGRWGHFYLETLRRGSSAPHCAMDQTGPTRPLPVQPCVLHAAAVLAARLTFCSASWSRGLCRHALRRAGTGRQLLLTPSPYNPSLRL